MKAFIIALLGILAWNATILVARFGFDVPSRIINIYAVGFYLTAMTIGLIVDFKKFTKTPAKVTTK